MSRALYNIANNPSNIPHYLKVMAREVGDCGARCAAGPGAKLILALDAFGWWAFAGITWALFVLLLLAPAAFRQPPDAKSSK